MTAFAFVFPGQGSQSVGMLDAWGDHPAVAATLQEASAALGEDIGRLIHDGPKEQLDLTTNTQPVMLTAGIAAYRAWRAEGGATPAAVAGHSLGEYTALVAAGVLTLADALPLVRLRATAMQEAVPVGVGAMAAILGLDARGRARRLQGRRRRRAARSSRRSTSTTRSRSSSPARKAGVDKACEMLKAAGAKRALPLPVSAPFHSSLMKPAARAPARGAGRGHAARAGDSRRQQRRRRHAGRRRRDPRRAGAPGRRPGALGRGRAGAARRAASPTSSSAARARCSPAWPSASTPTLVTARRLRSGHAGRSEGAAGMSDRQRRQRADRAGHRRLARHRPRHRAGARRARLPRDRHRHQRRRRAGDHRGAGRPFRLQGVKLDVNDAAGVTALVDGIVKEYGGLHVLVNNAGITRDDLAMRMKDDDWDAVHDTNLKSVFRMSREVMRPMMKQRFGRIINITSVVGASGNAGQANYAAAKAGVAGMTRALARELGSRNITVNCVAPGFIETDMTDVLPEAQKAALLRRSR